MTDNVIIFSLLREMAFVDNAVYRFISPRYWVSGTKIYFN